MKKFSFLMMVLLSLLLIVGCSNGSSGGASSSSSSSSKKASSDTLSQIKKNGKIIIATTGDYRPFTYKDKNNNLVGYDIEWGKIIAKGLGVKPEFVTGQFSGLIPGLNSNRFDVIISGVTATPERKSTLNISDSYAKDGPVAIVKKADNSIKDVRDLKGKIVGVNSGSVFEDTVKKIGGYKTLKTYPGPNEGLADLDNGRINVEVLSLISGTDYLKNAPNGSHFKIVGAPYEPYDLGIAMRKGDDRLTKAINKIIAEQKENGMYEKLSKKYLGVLIK
ncbi:substrate-binding periplasmic protein [Sporolactobacillus laevolacticus]|uniref:substrate-binding periplasmic protein n=1 Tax=Sporolactobacillus laevolacticus TaxID=33018 RepID=UPI0025B2AA70|nr:transporter substrate-binding domain-containing protein [Sporolactobacillus laevolacticus]MDN3954817.1 transporter substrate-binding domain-containing protein [Sporolactobacillus laevolacticus]